MSLDRSAGAPAPVALLLSSQRGTIRFCARRHLSRRAYASFIYQAASWTTPRRVVAKVAWHPGEFDPRVGFIVTNLSRSAERVVAFYNRRGTCEQDQGRQERG